MARKTIEARPGDREALADAIVRSREREGREPQSERAEVLADVMAERLAINQENSRGFAIAQCAEKGLQVLVDRFGAQKVAEAFVQAENTERRSAKNLPSVLDVLRILAPNSNERELVYQEIEGTADKMHAQYEAGKKLSGYEDIDEEFRPKNADVEQYRMTAFALRTLDAQTAVGKLAKMVGGAKYERLRLEEIMESLRNADLLREPAAFAERLEEAAGDLRRAAHNLVENAEEAREILVEKVMEIRQLADNAFNHAAEETRIARDTVRLNLNRDVNKLLAQDLTNATVRRAVEDAVAHATAEVDRQEDETNRRLEEAKKEHEEFLLGLAKQIV